MKNLSPAAKAVLDAAYEAWVTRDDPQSIAAAALRAVADRVVPEQKPWHRKSDAFAAKHQVRCKLLAIATELENSND